MTNIDKLRDNPYVIFVGGKPFMNYVTAVVMQFTAKGADKVVIKSRGKFISRAVDIAEVVRNRFLKGQVYVDDITMGSEGFKKSDNQQVTVSTLDISLGKMAKKIEPAIDVTPKESSDSLPTNSSPESSNGSTTDLQTEDMNISFDEPTISLAE